MRLKLLSTLALALCLGICSLPQANAATSYAAIGEKSMAAVSPQNPDVLEKINQISQAFQNRLETLDQNEQNGSLTETDQKIIEILDVTFPRVLNKIQEISLTELAPEMKSISEELAKLLLEDPPFDLEAETLELATGLAQSFAISYAVASELLPEEVMTELFMQSLSGLFAGGEEM